MNKSFNDLWIGLNQMARKALLPRDYGQGSLAERLRGAGVSAAELLAADCQTGEGKDMWIPGVEIFRRKVHTQRHRGIFAELARQEEGVLSAIGLWPKQWSAARMFAQSAKGFHIHPPGVPAATPASEWNRRLFVDQPADYASRPYDRE